MTNFTILMYEDDPNWKDSFVYRMNALGRNLNIITKEDKDTLEQDLMMSNPNLIMVDHDLGITTGDEIIRIIDGNPDYKKVSIYYYSGGETLDDLKKRASEFRCQIRCFSKKDDDLYEAILGLIGT
jgi:hypothetical protein